MSTFNLSNIKKVGFIPDFNPKKGYPELGFKKEVEVKQKINIKPVEVEEKAVPSWKKKLNKRIKWEKRKFKKHVGTDYKPVLLTTNKLD